MASCAQQLNSDFAFLWATSAQSLRSLGSLLTWPPSQDISVGSISEEITLELQVQRDPAQARHSELLHFLTWFGKIAGGDDCLILTEVPFNNELDKKPAPRLWQQAGICAAPEQCLGLKPVGSSHCLSPALLRTAAIQPSLPDGEIPLAAHSVARARNHS